MSKNITNKQGEAVGLSDAILASMRPLAELDKEFIKSYKEKKHNRAMESDKAVVRISIDRDLLEFLRCGGSGWQSRVNDLLRAAVGLR